MVSRSSKRVIKQLHKEAKEEVSLAQQAQRQGRFSEAIAHRNEAIALERSARRIELVEKYKSSSLSELSRGVNRMERTK